MRGQSQNGQAVGSKARSTEADTSGGSAARSASGGELRRVLDQSALGAFSPGFSPLLPLWVLATFLSHSRHTGLNVRPPGGSFKAQVLKEGGENQLRCHVCAALPGTMQPALSSCTPIPTSTP